MHLQGKNAIVTAGIRGIDRLKRHSPFRTSDEASYIKGVVLRVDGMERF